MSIWLKMRRFPAAANAGWVLLLAAAPAHGHHSTAPYVLIHGTVINGTVTTFDWENPHAHIYLDVTGEENAIEHCWFSWPGYDREVC